jgi:hypothetical protein
MPEGTCICVFLGLDAALLMPQEAIRGAVAHRYQTVAPPKKKLLRA